MTDIKVYADHVHGQDQSSSVVRHLTKGLGYMDRDLSSRDISPLGWHLLHEDVSLPVAVLYEDQLAHNLAWMQKFVSTYGAKLAPHGKTTMAPKLFLRQLHAGAWGITLATAPQTRSAYEHGVRRVLMANQLVGQQNMEIISRLVDDPEFEFFSLVDSAEQVELLGGFFARRKQKLNVLLELGVEGGRTGVRDQQQLQSLLAALARFREQFALCGVEIYEGILRDETSIRAFLQRAVDVTGELSRGGRFDRSPAILSGAGSSWYDVVAEEFSKANLGQPLDIILRPGCYLTHDVGSYREAQQRIKQHNPVAQKMDSSLLPALQLWAYVQSVPEENRAIMGLGKRDAPFDSGLPTPTLHYRPGDNVPKPVPHDWKLVHIMDQHAYLQMPEGADLHVGDMIGFDISHPCLTFDKWRYLLVLNAQYQVIDVVETFF